MESTCDHIWDIVYRVMCTTAVSSRQGGIALVIREKKDDNTLVDYFHVEAEQRQGPNVLSFQIVTGGRRFACIGAYVYVPPGKVDTLEFIERAWESLPRHAKLLLLGDLNVDLQDPRVGREAVADLVASLRLFDMVRHFQPHRKFRHGKTWRQLREGTFICSRAPGWTTRCYWADRGTGTATVEAKLTQQLAAVEQEPLYVIFLGLRKAYDTLYRGRTMKILEGYGVGPTVRSILQTFWEGHTVVLRQSGYYGEPFKVTRGVTQGHVISPTIFNVVTNAVVRYWLLLVCSDGRDSSIGFQARVRNKQVLFYADEGYLASRCTTWLQSSLQVLIGLFSRVGLETNISKTQSMTCFPHSIRGPLSDLVYRKRMSGEGESHWERQRARVVCLHPGCSASLAQGSVPVHMRMVHGAPYFTALICLPAGTAATYHVSFPSTREGHTLGAGCPGRALKRAGLRAHFARRHWQIQLIINEEGPLPRCEKCLMSVLQLGLNRSHPTSQACREGAERVRRRHLHEEAHRASEVTFTANGQMLEKVDVFKYLGRLLVINDDDAPALVRNLLRACSQWGRFSPVLTREGATPKTMGYFYQAIVQAVLLFSVETWVLTPQMLRHLEGFHHRVVRRIAKMGPSQRPGTNEWVYPPVDGALEVAGLSPIQVYITRRQHTIEDYISTRPILEVCKTTRRLPGTGNYQKWWDRPVTEK